MNIQLTGGTPLARVSLIKLINRMIETKHVFIADHFVPTQIFAVIVDGPVGTTLELQQLPGADKCQGIHNSVNQPRFFTRFPEREHPWWGWCKCCGAKWQLKSPSDLT
jgi:hypothetical protein